MRGSQIRFPLKEGKGRACTKIGKDVLREVCDHPGGKGKRRFSLSCPEKLQEGERDPPIVVDPTVKKKNSRERGS